MISMPIYSILPAFTEYLAEHGYTLAYPRVANVGLFWYITYFLMYMVSVEFGVYWMHRWLHDIEWAYKHLHYDHHKYNKAHTLSPFASLAFHPLDGILQAVPYTWGLMFCPMHFLTHEMILFGSGKSSAAVDPNSSVLLSSLLLSSLPLGRLGSFTVCHLVVCKSIQPMYAVPRLGWLLQHILL